MEKAGLSLQNQAERGIIGVRERGRKEPRRPFWETEEWNMWNNLKKAVTFSYDDGVEQDLRLIELMKQHGVKGTFNLNSSLFAPEGKVYPAGQIHRRMSRAQCLEAYDNEYCEVALHGANHSFLQAQPTALAMHEVITDRLQLEEMYGRTIRGMAYPYGTYSDSVVDILRLAGVAYCRTTQSHLNFRLPEDYLRWGATCHHKNAALIGRGIFRDIESPRARKAPAGFLLSFCLRKTTGKI